MTPRQIFFFNQLCLGKTPQFAIVAAGFTPCVRVQNMEAMMSSPYFQTELARAMQGVENRRQNLIQATGVCAQLMNDERLTPKERLQAMTQLAKMDIQISKMPTHQPTVHDLSHNPANNLTPPEEIFPTQEQAKEYDDQQVQKLRERAERAQAKKETNTKPISSTSPQPTSVPYHYNR